MNLLKKILSSAGKKRVVFALFSFFVFLFIVGGIMYFSGAHTSAATLERTFSYTVKASGTQTVSTNYDCSYKRAYTCEKSYDCSYKQPYTCYDSQQESYDCSYNDTRCYRFTRWIYYPGYGWYSYPSTSCYTVRISKTCYRSVTVKKTCYKTVSKTCYESRTCYETVPRTCTDTKQAPWSFSETNTATVSCDATRTLLKSYPYSGVTITSASVTDTSSEIDTWVELGSTSGSVYARGNCAPSSPTSFQFSPSSGTQGYVTTASWNASSYAKRYEYYAPSLGVSSWTSIGNVTNIPLNTSTFSPNTYTVSLRACNSSGCSGSANATFTVQQPTTPTTRPPFLRPGQ